MIGISRHGYFPPVFQDKFRVKELSQKQLNPKERFFTEQRSKELQSKPIQGKFDLIIILSSY